MTPNEQIVFEQDNKQVIKINNHFFTRVFENGESFESGDFNTLERAKENIGIYPINKYSIDNKKSFKIALYSSCPIYGKLKFKGDKGYLKYYDSNEEIIIDLDNYNQNIIQSIIKQAEVICEMKYSVLWSY